MQNLHTGSNVIFLKMQNWLIFYFTRLNYRTFVSAPYPCLVRPLAVCLLETVSQNCRGYSILSPGRNILKWKEICVHTFGLGNHSRLPILLSIFLALELRKSFKIDRSNFQGNFFFNN